MRNIASREQEKKKYVWVVAYRCYSVISRFVGRKEGEGKGGDGGGKKGEMEEGGWGEEGGAWKWEKCDRCWHKPPLKI